MMKWFPRRVCVRAGRRLVGLLLVVLLAACGGQPASLATVTAEGYPAPAASAYPASGPGQPAAAPLATTAAAYPPGGAAQGAPLTPAVAGGASGEYPPGGATQAAQPTLAATSGAPGAYPPAQTTPGALPTLASASATTVPLTALPTATRTARPTLAATRPPTALLAARLTIWHAWRGAELVALEHLAAEFQKSYPNVVFDLTYVAAEDLLARYQAAAYDGGGPILLLGPSDWGPELYDAELVADLSPYASQEFRAGMNQAALELVTYRGALVGLPHAVRGMVLYRNNALIPQAPKTFTELLTFAGQVSQTGAVGAFLERSAYFAVPHLYGLGGRLLDEDGQPVFNADDYQTSLEWLRMLEQFEQAGAVAVNDDADEQTFSEGRAGLVIAGSWARFDLASQLGAEKLTIDPWPVYDSPTATVRGRLSGFVLAHNVYLNANAAALSTNEQANQQAGLLFIGYLMTPQVQAVLAEAGFVPANRQAQPSQPLTRQAMVALSNGVAYPHELTGDLRSMYLDAIDGMLRDVFEHQQQPRTALELLEQAILGRLKQMPP